MPITKATREERIASIKINIQKRIQQADNVIRELSNQYPGAVDISENIYNQMKDLKFAGAGAQAGNGVKWITAYTRAAGGKGVKVPEGTKKLTAIKIRSYKLSRLLKLSDDDLLGYEKKLGGYASTLNKRDKGQVRRNIMEGNQRGVSERGLQYIQSGKRKIKPYVYEYDIGGTTYVQHPGGRYLYEDTMHDAPLRYTKSGFIHDHPGAVLLQPRRDAPGNYIAGGYTKESFGQINPEEYKYKGYGVYGKVPKEYQRIYGVPKGTKKGPRSLEQKEQTALKTLRKIEEERQRLRQQQIPPQPFQQIEEIQEPEEY